MTLDEQILAALAVAQAEAGEDGDLFAFYGSLLRHLYNRKAALSPALDPLLDSRAVATRLAAGQPALAWPALAPALTGWESWLRTLAALFEARDPGTQDELEAIPVAEWGGAAQRWYETGVSEFGPTVDALMANALAPYLERAAEVLRPHLPLESWLEPFCPVCAGFPDFALWDEPRHTFTLLCERCRTMWPHDTVGCLFCGEDDPDAYGFYSSEDDLYRLIVCDRCGHYLKTIHQPQAQQLPTPPLLPAERLLTPGLDLLAAQEGYTRPIGVGHGGPTIGQRNGRGN